MAPGYVPQRTTIQALMDPSLPARIAQIQAMPSNAVRISAAGQQVDRNRRKRLIVLLLTVVAGVAGFVLLPTPQRGYVATACMLAGVGFLLITSAHERQSGTSGAALYQGVLAPILAEAVPGVSVQTTGYLQDALVKAILPDCSNYSGSMLMELHEEYGTVVSNVRATHEQGGDADDDSTTVTDFLGSVVVCRPPQLTGLPGTLRIVPTRKGIIRKEVRGPYRGPQRGEMELQVPDPTCNTNYAFFATDQLLAGRALNPAVIRLLNHWTAQMPVSVPLHAGALCIAFHTGQETLTAPPRAKDFTEITLASGFAQLQTTLENVYALVQAIG